jgi:hypothetical protein
MGTTNTCERPRKRRNVRQAKRADRLEPKGMRQGTVLCSLDRHGQHCRRRTGRVRTIRKFIRNRVSPSRCRQRQANREERCWCGG